MPKDDRQRSLDILGVVRNASKNDIRLAFFKKSLYTHPDCVKNNSDDKFMASFPEVTQAYSNLSDGSVHEGSTPDEIFFKFFQEVLKDDNAQSLRAMFQEHEAAKCADDEYRVDEDDNEIDIEREFERLLEILKNRKKKGKEVPEDMTQQKVEKCRDNLVRQREDAKKDLKKQPPKKGKQVQVPVSKPKPKSKKQLLAEQRRREKEMEKIAVELDKKKKEDEEKEKVKKQMEAEKQKRLEEERKKSEAEARRQREREQKERERLQKLEQERERKQKEEEERRKKEEMKRKKAEQERVEKDKAEKAAKIKAAQQAAKEKEEQAKNSNKNQNVKRSQPQRNDQTYPREIPPRFQRRMKQQQQQQQQQQTVFPSQPSTTTVSQTVTQQPQASTQNQQTLQSKAVSKPSQTVGKKKDPQRWTKGEYVGIIEDVQDDLGWSKAPPAKSSENWEETTDEWGCEGTSWEEKPSGDERVIVDKSDQDSWPTVGGKGKNKDEIPGNVDAVLEKENWSERVSTFGDSLDAVIDGMEAAEEAAGTGLLNSGKWSQNSSQNSEKDSNGSLSQDFDTRSQSWSKTPGKDVKLKGNSKTDNSENLSNSWEESASGSKEGASGWNENISRKDGTSGWKESTSGLKQGTSGLKQNTSGSKQNTSGWQEQPEVGDKWKTVGNPGSKNEATPSEETGWGESSASKRNSGSNWGSSSWSAQGLSLTGTEIWDQSSNDENGGDKGSDWLKTSEDTKDNTDKGWDTLGQSGGSEDGMDNWSSWSTAGSKRSKAPKPNPGNDENAWLRRSLKQLVDMGFKEVDGEKALKSNNMSLEAAISQLLGGQGTPPGKQSPLGTSLPSDLSSEANGSTQTDLADEQDVSKLNRKQRRRLMQQNLGSASEMQATNSEPVSENSGERESPGINMLPVSSTAVSVASVSRATISSESHVETRNELTQSEQPKDVHLERTSGAVGTPSSIPGSVQVTGSASTTSVASAVITNSAPVRAPLPTVYQQQLLQQQAQLQQLRLAQASGLMRNPLASQPVILIGQLSQLRLVQQQLAAQQQLLQKQPQPNTLQAQQLALQQQQIGAMITQIQQQLIQQQQLQQQAQQQQIPSNQFPNPAQQTVLTSKPQIQQLLLQQRKQLQQLQQITPQNKQSPLQGPTEPETNSGGADESSASDVKTISPRSNVAKERTSLVQVVNSAPASPSTGKSRLGQWTQNTIQSERLSPKLPDSTGRDRNLRASPQLDTSEKATSLLITRSTNSPNLTQSTLNSAPVHRVVDPVSSKWGIDAGPKLSAEPPEFTPGVRWRPYQPKSTSESIVSETVVTSARTGMQEWPGNSIGSQTVSSTFTNAGSKVNIAPLTTVPNSQISNSQNMHSSAIWQAPVSRQASIQRPNPLSSNIRPPPGLGSENSFLNLPDVQQIGQSGDSNWHSGALSDSQMASVGSSQFGIRPPGFQPWSSDRRSDAGWPGTGGQTLDTLPSVPRASMELRNLAMLGDSTVDVNSSGMRVKTEMSGQQLSYHHALSTWLVIRNISPRIDSTALRSLCQQHGPLLTFQLNLRYGNSLIRYGNKDEAAKAHANLNGLVLGGSRLTADFATDSDIGSFFEQTSDWSTPQPITTWASAPTQKTEPSTQWPGSKPLLPPTNFSSELWSFTQTGGLASGVWSAPPSNRREGEQSTTVTENGITSPSMVTFLPPGLLNSGESS